MSVNTSCVCTDNADALIVAGGNTATAEDTLVVISDHMCGRIIKLINGLVTVIFVRFGNTVFETKLLKLTVAASYTGKTLSFVG